MIGLTQPTHGRKTLGGKRILCKRNAGPDELLCATVPEERRLHLNASQGSAMPKEQFCLRGDGARAASSKNAKERSNSLTLLAMRDARDADESSGRGSGCSSEKDSGFSDGSDWQQTDMEDQHSDRGRAIDGERADQNRERERGRGGPVTPTPAGREQFSVIKKLTQVELHVPSSRRSVVTWKKINSYPRIAPRPGRTPSGDEPQDLSGSESSSGTGGRPEQHQGDTVSSSSSAIPSSSNVSSSASRGPHRGGGVPTSARHRRFLNTVKVLRQSGLLDIALRTKELQRRSDATSQDVAQLRRHAELLCEAACSPDGAAALQRLHRAMAESHSYPDLNLNLNLLPPHPEPSAGRPHSISSVPPSSRLVTIVLNPARELDAFMSPDSSTG